MVTEQQSTGVGGRRRTGAESLARWSMIATVLVGLAGVADLVRWGNRWYVTEVFARDAGTFDDASWEWLYGMLHSAHEALVRALVLLLLAAALAAITILVRRRAAR